VALVGEAGTGVAAWVAVGTGGVAVGAVVAVAGGGAGVFVAAVVGVGADCTADCTVAVGDVPQAPSSNAKLRARHTNKR
jgi:hypothetical protein